MTFDPTSVEVTCVTVPKDHYVQVPWEYVNVCGYSYQFCKNYHIHTYTHILRTYYVHTTYRISDHIVSQARQKSCWEVWLVQGLLNGDPQAKSNPPIHVWSLVSFKIHRIIECKWSLYFQSYFASLGTFTEVEMGVSVYMCSPPPLIGDTATIFKPQGIVFETIKCLRASQRPFKSSIYRASCKFCHDQTSLLNFEPIFMTLI